MASHAGQDRTRERIEQQRDLATTACAASRITSGVEGRRQRPAAYSAEVVRNWREREGQADLKLQQAEQEQTKAVQREKVTTLVAPVAGRVQQLVINTAGGVVTEAQVLMVIVPDGEVVTAEVVLENKDIGFVDAGRLAEVKLETFPFTRNGTMEAQVKHVAADAVNDEKQGAVIPAVLTLKRKTIDVDEKLVTLNPGMSVTAEIKTGKRRVIEYLLSPMQRPGNESMREIKICRMP